MRRDVTTTYLGNYAWATANDIAGALEDAGIVWWSKNPGTFTRVLFAEFGVRSFAVDSEDELKKFYASLKPDDPRRQRLESLDGGEDFLPELRRVWVMDRWGRGRGGPPPGKFGAGPPREGDKDRDRGKRPPPPPDSK